MAVQPVPDRNHTVTPHLVIKGAKEALDFYQRALGAELEGSFESPDGQSVMHAEIKIGDSIVMIADEFPGTTSPGTLGGTTVTLHLYVEDTDALFQRAVDAGCTAEMPPMDAFWGDRYATVLDPFGHRWSIATHLRDMTMEETAKAAEEFFKNMPEGCS